MNKEKILELVGDWIDQAQSHPKGYPYTARQSIELRITGYPDHRGLPHISVEEKVERGHGTLEKLTDD